MSYRHASHAGNFADVFKHVILARLLAALAREAPGFVYLETHAGAGRYDLSGLEARSGGAYREGIGRLWAEPPAAEEGIAEYLAAVRAINPGAPGEAARAEASPAREPRRAPRYYPGSPHIARFFLRPQDRMRLAERAPDACARLQAEVAGDARASVHCGDGFAALSRWLPPLEPRGLVLIDPPYDHRDDWRRAADALIRAARRWAHGSYAIWYPITPGAPLAWCEAELARAGLRKLLRAEMTVRPRDMPARMNGCGMFLLNPPGRLEDGLEVVVGALAERLRQGPGGGARVGWLAPA